MFVRNWGCIPVSAEMIWERGMLATLVVQPIRLWFWGQFISKQSVYLPTAQTFGVHSEICVLLLDIWMLLAVKSDSPEVARRGWLSLYLHILEYQRCWSSRKVNCQLAHDALILRSGCLLAHNFQVDLKHSCTVRICIVIVYLGKVRQHYGH